jgi:hypothetical protein
MGAAAGTVLALIGGYLSGSMVRSKQFWLGRGDPAADL